MDRGVISCRTPLGRSEKLRPPPVGRYLRVGLHFELFRPRGPLPAPPPRRSSMARHVLANFRSVRNNVLSNLAHATALVKYGIFMWQVPPGARRMVTRVFRFSPFARYLSFDEEIGHLTLRSLLTRHLRPLVNSINRTRRCDIAGTQSAEANEETATSEVA